MKKILTLLLVLITVSTIDAKPKATNSELDLRIGTYNIWADYARKSKIRQKKSDALRNWDNSKMAVAELIVKLDCDLIAIQEVSNNCYEDLLYLLKKAGGKKYGIWWVNVYPEGYKRQVGSAIIYNKKEFKLSRQNNYFLSETPEVRSHGWDETRYLRAALTTDVTHKKSGKKFFFIAVHGPLKDYASEQAGKLITEFAKRYNPKDLPTIVVGDMNACPGDGFYKNMTKFYDDAFVVAEKNNCKLPGTYNGPGGGDEHFTRSDRRIDHVYIHSTDNGKITVKDYTVNRDKYKSGGKEFYPSDHNPVVVNMKLK